MTPPMTEIEQVRREVIKHGESISAIVVDARNTKDQLIALQHGIERDREVREVKDEHLNERLDDIEASIEKVNKLSWAIFGTFGASFAVAVTNFVINGGLGGH